jgi:hypothetical protein
MPESLTVSLSRWLLMSWITIVWSMDVNYAQNRANFRSGEIRIFDSTGKVERTIQLTEPDRKL